MLLSEETANAWNKMLSKKYQHFRQDFIDLNILLHSPLILNIFNCCFNANYYQKLITSLDDWTTQTFLWGYPNSTKLLTKISLHQHLVAVIRMPCKSLMNSFEIQWILMRTFAKQFGIRTEKLFSKIYVSHINTDIYNYVKHLWGPISPALAGLVLL